MQLVTVICTFQIVTKPCAVGQTEEPPTLLADVDARLRLFRAIALTELVRVGVGLDRRAEQLERDEVQVLDVVCVRRVGLGTRRRLGDGRQTVPSEALVVGTGIVREIEDAAVDAGLVPTLADVIPGRAVMRCYSFQKKRVKT
jgi:hypothetical protein